MSAVSLIQLRYITILVDRIAFATNISCPWFVAVEKLNANTIVGIVSPKNSITMFRCTERLHQCNHVSSLIFFWPHIRPCRVYMCVLVYYAVYIVCIVCLEPKDPTTKMKFHWKLNDTTRNAI